MYIRELIWDEENVQHIAAHGVEPEEVEQIAFGKRYVRRGRGTSRYLLYGQTGEGRYLFIVLDRLAEDLFYVVTAREMEQNERQLYRRIMRK